jgi:nitrite reductase (NO-forming)
MSQTYHQLNAEKEEASGMHRFGIGSILTLTLAALTLLVVVSVKSNGGQEATDTPPAHSGMAGAISVNAFDLGFDPATLSVEAAGDYEVTLVNTGSAPHDITFPDGQTIAVAAGETATAMMTIPEGGTTYLCSIPGHAAAGMTGAFSVGGGTVATADDHGGPGPVTDVLADPNAPGYFPRDATAPDRLSGKTHDIDLVMYEKLMTIAEGYHQAVWTFGDSVPGPVIRVKVGDLVRIHLINPASNKMPHSIDFHSSLVAWNDEMTSIQPGEEKLYEFRAEFAGVWMYHCGTGPALHHIANGMYGMMIVEPAEGLSKVDQEFAIVQSEWYLGPQGDVSSLEKAMAAAPAPDFILFNGVANQYLDHPIKIATGKRVRVFILNAGPSVDSSFHIVGTIFDRVVKEGVELRIGNTGNYGAQAVDLSPAQGAFVEFIMAEDGLYPIVTHAFNFVGRGALGLFQAGDGDPKN